jgi:amidophosphoribosyltransferase
MFCDRPRDECGIVGIYGNPEAAKLTYLGLQALQHRGQESAGIVSSDGGAQHIYKEKGLVGDVFNEANLAQLPGRFAIGHVRYSTTGSNRVVNAQPIRVDYKGGALAVAHNGNITNAVKLREELEARGAIFQSTNDSEILVHMIAQHHSHDFMQSLTSSLLGLQGAFSLVLLHNDCMVAVRDPHGVRPLCYGAVPGGGAVVASESCAMDIMGAQYMREIKPGEMIVITPEETRSLSPFPAAKPAFCVFEYIYISRPDSMIDGHCTVSDVRERLGRQLAREHPAEADVVFPVPDSSNPAAIGYALESGIPFGLGLIRSHYIGRTFIEPDQAIRDFGARLKYNAVRSVIAGKRVVVVDDSIVRGTTSKKIVRLIRNAGAKEVHFRVSAPIWQHPCYYGVDTPSREELIGSNKSADEIREHIGADSIGYLSIEGLLRMAPRTNSYCQACFDGNYVAGRPEASFEKNIMEGARTSPTGTAG